MNLLLEASWNFDLTNYDAVWKLMVNVGILLIALLVGNILRNVIPFFKKFLIPSALLGGAILLLITFLVKVCTRSDANPDGFQLLDQQIMQIITYHGLGIGFVAMTLKSNKNKGKAETMKVIENGAMTGGAYMLQAFVGLLITIGLYFLTKDTDNSIFHASGVVLPLGFGQGPGNALIWGNNLGISATEEGFLNFTGSAGMSFGLTIASIGFIVASVIGVIYINIFKKKGEIKHRVDNQTRTLEEFEEENEIPDSESVDKFSIQLCFVFLAYAIAFGIMCIFAKISNFTNNLAWGFNFIWGVIAANIVKLIVKLLTKKRAVKRVYINNYQMDRISGFAFDAMIVAGVAAIDIESLKGYIWPIIILSVVGTIITYIYIRLVTRHCFKGYEHEMFVTNFGTVTGTASNGMILLKEIDPNYETPAANSFIVSQLPAMLFVAPLLLLLPAFFQPSSLKNTIIATCIFFLLFVGYTVFLFRKTIFKKKSDK